MRYLAFFIALGIVGLFGVWAGQRRRKSYQAGNRSYQPSKLKGKKGRPVKKSKQVDYLRRVK